MDSEKINRLVLSIKLFKNINYSIFEAILQYFINTDLEILKSKDSYTFSITSPNDYSGRIYLMIANFPDERGFDQT